MTAPRTLLKAWQTPPKKQFGQNFLCDPSTPRMIVSRANVSEDHVVLEIGAGLGALTIPLAQAARKVIAVEKDQRLHALLNTELALHGIDNVQLIASDILSVDISAVAKAENTRLHVFGNLPYNISSQILVQLIAHRRHVARCVLMFQKELAERLRAEPGNKAYGRISVMLQYCAAVSPVATLEAHLFYPKPGIDSEVIEIDFSIPPRHDAPGDAVLFAVIKAAFSKRRKTLKNALSTGELPLTAAQTSRALENAGILPTRRAETLSTDEFVVLARAVQTELLQ